VHLLIIVSVLWALSFGLITLVSGLGATFVAAARTLLAALVFLPFVSLRGLKRRDILALAATGAVQFGLMYVLYIQSYRWLHAGEVALFTIFTPVFVTLAEDALVRRFSWVTLAVAALAVVGTGVCLWTSLDRHGLFLGFLCLQLSNLCFALGQVFYRRIAPGTGKGDIQLMGILYVGAVLVTVAMAAPTVQWARVWAMTWTQGWTLLYLGVVASGVGFFLFNAGARRTDIGTLAVTNNAKVPLGVLAAGLVFHEKVDWPRLAAGGLVIAGALALNEVAARRGKTPIMARR
jgi:drug/metabolite transporter (DMT)-like permease